MKQPRMNVQDIAEILINELDQMKKTTARLEKVLPAVDHRLQQIQQSKIAVDTEKAQAILRRFETLSSERTYFPTWVMIFFIVAPLLALSGLFWGWTESGNATEARQAIEVYQQYIQESNQAEQFNDWIKQK